MEEMTPAKFRTEFIMLSLRMTEGLSLDELRARFGCDLRTEKGDVLAALEAGGLVAVDGDRIRLAARGLFVSDEVIVRLI
jgi:coproporphyrinogen III oxidase-like Fe-S oxidoreductase